MELLSLSELSMEDESTKMEKLTAMKEKALSGFSAESREMVDNIIDELVCEAVFEHHMKFKTGIFDPEKHRQAMRPPPPNESFVLLAEELNVTKVNQDVDCPKCCTPVKCQWLSKHLAGCMNPHQSTYSYSSRNSSRIARQRIQEGFKTSYDESKNDSDDERAKPKKRGGNKGRKNKGK